MGALLSGNGVPSSGLGNDTDFYIDLDTSAVYGPKATTWSLYKTLVAVAGSVEGVQVHAAGGGLKAVAPGTVGNVMTNVAGVWTSSPQGAGREVASFTFETIGDGGDELAHSLDVSDFDDGAYEFTLHARGSSGVAGGAVQAIMREKRQLVGIVDGAIVSYATQLTQASLQIPGTGSVTLATATAKFLEATGDSLDVMIRGEALSTVSWEGEIEMRPVDVGDGVGWHNDAVFDPAVLDLSMWVRGDFASSPWSGVVSAGHSGERSLSETTNPPSVGTTLNTWDSADFDGTNDTLKATTGGATTWTSYITDTAYTMSVLFWADAATADAGNADSYVNPPIVADATQGAIGIGFTTSGVRAWHQVGGDYASVALAATTGAWHLVQVRYDGTTLQTRIDGGSWSNQTRGHVSATALGAQPQFGMNYASNKFFNGKVMEIIVAPSALSDANCDNILDYTNARYALSL